MSIVIFAFIAENFQNHYKRMDSYLHTWNENKEWFIMSSVAIYFFAVIR